MDNLKDQSIFIKYDIKEDQKEIQHINCLTVKELEHLNINEDVLNLKLIAEEEYING